MTFKLALPMLAAVLLLSSGCARQAAPQPIPAVPEQLTCPAPAQPPAELIKRPEKIDFLSTALETGLSTTLETGLSTTLETGLSTALETGLPPLPPAPQT